MKLLNLTTRIALFLISIFSILVFAANIPTDSQMVKFITTDNGNQSSEARLAISKSKNLQITTLADSIIKENLQRDKEIISLEKELKLRPDNNQVIIELKKMGHESFSKLKKLKGDEFDKAFIAIQIEEHQKVLDYLDNDLIPHSKNSKIKQMLQSTRTSLNLHLNEAKKIQSSFNK